MRLDRRNRVSPVERVYVRAAFLQATIDARYVRSLTETLSNTEACQLQSTRIICQGNKNRRLRAILLSTPS